MKVTIKGYFSIDAEEAHIDVRMFEQNAIAILFPYLGAIVVKRHFLITSGDAVASN